MDLRFQIAGFPVRIRILHAVVAALIAAPFVGEYGPLAVLGLGAGITFGALSHELGHAMAGRIFGLRAGIELVAFGGRTRFVGESLSPGRGIVIALAGPAVNLVFGGLLFLPVFFGFLPPSPGAQRVAQVLPIIYLAWGLMNLVPVLPLDGGQAMHALGRMVSARRGGEVAAWISATFATLAVGAGIALAIVTGDRGGLFIVALSVIGVIESVRVARFERLARRGGAPRSAADDTDAEWIRMAQSERVLAEAAEREAAAETDAQRAAALTLRAWGELLRGSPDAARETLESIRSLGEVDPALEGAVLFDLGEADASLGYLEQALERGNRHVRGRMIEAIIRTERFAEAAKLFDDAIGATFNAAAVRRVYRAARRAEAVDALVDLAKAIFRRDGAGGSAIRVARHLADAHDDEGALTWIDKARIAGFDDAAALDGDPRFDALRAHVRWAEVRGAFTASGRDGDG